ncbi:MAG: maltose alpha-D-glucosyltransferase [Alphaproteobacteria bacterium]|nr:maltose alpha-D-glucosyltransferase [Alphaproteobacteria bacterium]
MPPLVPDAQITAALEETSCDAVAWAPAAAQELWYKDAIIYQLHIKAFCDADGNGVGDFAGLMEKLDYVQELGATAIWLLPFYPSPMRDDGYDISDYRDVNPTYGSLPDFRRFVRAAHKRGLRVIVELVVNHTSDQHVWFQQAREARPGSARRNFYVWSDSDQKYADTRIIFTDTEKSNWSWDPVAKAYYWHRFYSHQPDLNFANPAVVKAMISNMQFWLDIGVDGLRLDAIPYLCEREGTNNENLPETHEVVRQIRAAMDGRYPDRMFLAEANQWPEDVRPYFGEGDECHMAFHFPLMPRIYMALAREDRHPITDIMRQTPEIPDTCQWAIFLRNHDELTLEMVTDRERDYLWEFYAADRRARINLGIRRRLAPLLDNDRRKIELLNSLLMSMPGTPIIYYGDEIGMGDNIYLGDRDGVRTPMQWSPDRNGGFSRAAPEQLYLPPIMDPVYGYESVNVEAQSRSASSLLSWMKRLIAVRKSSLAFGRGSLNFLYPGNRKVLAYVREFAGESILCIANLSRAPQPVELDLSAYKGCVPVEMIGRSPFPPIGDLPYFVTLASFGFYWFRLTKETDGPEWHIDVPAPMPDLLTLVLPDGLESALAPNALDQILQQLLPEYLPKQRWFAGKGDEIVSIELARHAELPTPGDTVLFCVFDVSFKSGAVQSYFLPLAVAWERRDGEFLDQYLPFCIARGRKGPELGLLHDAVDNPDLIRMLLQGIAQEANYEISSGSRLVFRRTDRFSPAAFDNDLAMQRVGKEQSNISLLIGNAGILKLFRRLSEGVHPEMEISHFLGEVARFPHTPSLLGSVELVDGKDKTTAIGVLQGYVQNQGDAWGYTLNYLDRYLSEIALVGVGARTEGEHAGIVASFATLGRRTGEMHRAFCMSGAPRAFAPEKIEKDDLARWLRDIRVEARHAKRALRRGIAALDEKARVLADGLLRNWSVVEWRIENMLPAEVDAVKTRLHGDYHLGQVLVAQNDFYIIDFEGEPARPIPERRRKHSSLRDVGGMLRSIEYAGWAALAEATKDGGADMVTLRPLVRDWKRQVRAAFLAGYRRGVGKSPGYPRDPQVAQSLVDFFELEKALYEIRYEASSRPAWLSIPVAGVSRLVGITDEQLSASE